MVEDAEDGVEDVQVVVEGGGVAPAEQPGAAQGGGDRRTDRRGGVGARARPNVKSARAK